MHGRRFADASQSIAPVGANGIDFVSLFGKTAGKVCEQLAGGC
jgi:hypothetical protein